MKPVENPGLSPPSTVRFLATPLPASRQSYNRGYIFKESPQLRTNTGKEEQTMKMYDVVPGLEFDPEKDLAQSPAWFLDATHSVPPWTPMFGG